MVSMLLSLLLHALSQRFVEANCKLKLLVFDRAHGLYSEAGDKTDTGQQKSKFILFCEHVKQESLFWLACFPQCVMEEMILCSVCELFRYDFIRKSFTCLFVPQIYNANFK